MSARSTWHRPQRAEVLPRKYTFREHMALACGLAAAIVFMRIWGWLPR